MGDGMTLTKEQEKLWTQYRFAELTIKDFLSFYEQAEGKNFKFQSLMNDYLKEHMNVSLMMDYIYTLHIDLELSSKEIYFQLQPFFEWLDSLDYNLTMDDAVLLIEFPLFQTLFLKIFGEEKKISEKNYQKLVSSNMYFETMVEAYIDLYHIEVVNDEKQLKKVDNVEKIVLSNEEIELFKRAQEGDKEALDSLILANNGLVVYVIKKFLNRGLDFDDLLQEGRIGLMTAILRYNYQKGYRFSTYATWWIKAFIQRAINKTSSSIRLPDYKIAQINHVSLIRSQMIKELNREPTNEELAERLGMSEIDLVNLLQTMPYIISLESKMSDEDERTLEDSCEDEKARFEDDVIDKQCVKEILDIGKQILEEREYNVLMLRFGLINGIPKSLEEISKIMGFSRERIRQIEEKALRKLRIASRKVTVKKYNSDSNERAFKNYVMFQACSIHSSLTLSMLCDFLSLFPLHEQKVYCRLRGIQLSRKVVIPLKEKNFTETENKYIHIIENDLLFMFRKYLERREKKKCSHQDAIQYVSNLMKRVSLRFRYSDYKQPEIMKAVRLLSLKRYQSIMEGHGKDLCKHLEKSSSNLYSAYKEIDDILNGRKAKISQKNLLFKLMSEYPHITKKQWILYVETLPKKQKEAIYLIHGDSLNEINPFPKDTYSKVYISYYNAIKNLRKICQRRLGLSLSKKGTIIDIYGKERIRTIFPYLNKKELSVFLYFHGPNLDEMNEAPSNLFHLNHLYQQVVERMEVLLEQYNDLFLQFLSSTGLTSFEEAKYYISLLSLDEQTIIYQRRGERLNEINSFIQGKHFISFKPQYEMAIGQIRQMKIQEKRKRELELQKEVLNLQKQRLLDAKLLEYRDSLYQEYFPLYGTFINDIQLMQIINDAICSFQSNEGISLEDSSHFKIEVNILEKLINIYQSSLRQDVYEAILDLLGVKLKDKYSFVKRPIKSPVIQQYFQRYINSQILFESLGTKLIRS